MRNQVHRGEIRPWPKQSDVPGWLRAVVQRGLVYATHGERRLRLDFYRPAVAGPHPAVRSDQPRDRTSGSTDQDSAERFFDD